MGKVFVSYSHEDNDFVEKLQAILDDCEVDYFLDRKGIAWGESFPDVIAENLRLSTALIVVLSPASLESQWVSYEVGQARALNKRVLPLLYHPRQKLPGFLLHTHHLSCLEDARKFFEEGGIAEPSEPAPQPGDEGDRCNLLGRWYSTYEDYQIGLPTNVWQMETIEISRIGKKTFRAENRDNPAEDSYISTLDLVQDRELSGRWESRLPGGHAAGVAFLLIAPRGNIMHGVFTGPRDTGELCFFRWVLARNQVDLEKGKRLLENALRRSADGRS